MADRATGERPPAGGSNPPLESLSPEQHRILAYASAIGSEFDFPLLLGAMGIDEEGLAEEVERLVHRGVLTERAGGERFAFTEEEFRARIYRSLTESRLRVLHRKIAEVLERTHPEPTLSVLAELGRHYFLGRSRRSPTNTTDALPRRHGRRANPRSPPTTWNASSSTWPLSPGTDGTSRPRSRRLWGTSTIPSTTSTARTCGSRRPWNGSGPGPLGSMPGWCCPAPRSLGRTSTSTPPSHSVRKRSDCSRKWTTGSERGRRTAFSAVSRSSGERTGTLSKNACGHSTSSGTGRTSVSSAASPSNSGTRSITSAPRSRTSRSHGTNAPASACSARATGSSCLGRTTISVCSWAKPVPRT